MFRRMLALCGVFVALCLAVGVPAFAQSGFLAVRQTNLLDSNGSRISNATMCASVTLNGQNASVQAKGSATVSFSTRCAAIVNGAWSMNLPDMSLSTPRYACLKMDATDDLTGDHLLTGYVCVQPRSVPPPNIGSTPFWCNPSGCDFDLLPPNYPANIAFIGPAGPQGIQGVPGPAGTVTASGVNGDFDVPGVTTTKSVVAGGNKLTTFAGNKTGSAQDTSGAYTYSADTGAGDRRSFDLRNAAEWDATLNPWFSHGLWSTSASGARAALTRAVDYGVAQYNGFVLQAQLYFSGSNVGNFICETNNVGGLGAVAPVASRDCIGFTAAGFVMDVGGSQTTLLPAASMGNTWYTVTIWDLGGGAFTASLIPATPNSGSTWGGFGFIGSVSGVPNPTNFQFESTAATDLQRNMRYAIGGPAPETLMVPMGSDAQNSPTLVTLLDAGGTQTWALIPASYRPGVQSPWVLYNHGYGGSGQGITNEGGLQNLVNGLVQAGYVVVASNYSNNTCMGNNPCVIDDELVQQLWGQYLNLAPQPYVIGESMGGLVTWNSIIHGKLHPRAVWGTYPICNLAAVYADTTNPTLQAAITSSFGINGGNPYATATAGYDPMLSISSFLSFPIIITSSYADVTVYRATNADPFAAAVNAAGGNATVLTSTGVHGDSSNFTPAVVSAIIKFFQDN